MSSALRHEGVEDLDADVTAGAEVLVRDLVLQAELELLTELFAGDAARVSTLLGTCASLNGVSLASSTHTNASLPVRSTSSSIGSREAELLARLARASRAGSGSVRSSPSAPRFERRIVWRFAKVATWTAARGSRREESGSPRLEV